MKNKTLKVFHFIVDEKYCHNEYEFILDAAGNDKNFIYKN